MTMISLCLKDALLTGHPWMWLSLNSYPQISTSAELGSYQRSTVERQAALLQDDGAQGLSSEDSSASSSFETITESGVVYKVDLVHGQKTGFYADQRDSRNLISSVSSDKTVLDLCCYTGGFALSAAHGRAHSVTGGLLLSSSEFHCTTLLYRLNLGCMTLQKPDEAWHGRLSQRQCRQHASSLVRRNFQCHLILCLWHLHQVQSCLHIVHTLSGL